MQCCDECHVGSPAQLACKLGHGTASRSGRGSVSGRTESLTHCPFTFCPAPLVPAARIAATVGWPLLIGHFSCSKPISHFSCCRWRTPPTRSSDRCWLLLPCPPASLSCSCCVAATRNMDGNVDALPAVVLDCGAGLTKAGFAGEDAPAAAFQTVVGRPKHPGVLSPTQETFVGDEAQAKRGVLTLDYPIERGAVTRWDDMERVWQHAFENVLRVEPDERAVMLAESPLASKRQRERVTQAMFETLGVPALYQHPSAALAMFAAGRTTGCVLECGHSLTCALAIYEGYCLPHTAMRLGIAGRDVTDHLVKLLGEESGRRFTTGTEHDVVREIKERLAFVSGTGIGSAARDSRAFGELSGSGSSRGSGAESLDRVFTLPDGTQLSLGSERYRCAEGLFRPALLHMPELDGVHSCAHTAILACDPEIRRDMYANLVLAGGTTMLPGFQERMQRELAELAPSVVGLRVVAPAERQHSVWIGGAILASLSTFKDRWLMKAEYEEHGAAIVHRKCIG